MSMMDFGGSGNSLLQPRVQSVTSNQGGGLSTPSGGGLMQSLIAQLQQQSQQANKDSLAQYQNLLNATNQSQNSVVGKGGMFDQASGLMEHAGESQMAMLRDQQKQNLGQADQSAVSRGLGNTTIRQGMLNGVNRNSELAQNNLTEGINAQKAGLLTQKAGAAQNYGGMQQNAITARQNQGPDLSMFLNLIQALGQQGGGGAAVNPATAAPNMMNSFSSGGSTTFR